MDEDCPTLEFNVLEFFQADTIEFQPIKIDSSWTVPD